MTSHAPHPTQSAIPHELDHHDEDEYVVHGTVRSYLTGFVLAAILTVIPFWIVMGDVIQTSRTAGLVLMGLAIVQIVVHVEFFLHLDTKGESGWNMLAFLFTLILVVITLSGSIWIMYHLDSNMMPMSPHDMRKMP
ncbi:cytochrome o ubiquinol oxidase subunit IV [Bordetella sp. 02P26C-1]|uniref:cytochrome o ubiquinol oxidase subunit IV n=1 Tax=Bordetella sp. 02P26C-1 TaxID=2683195 RepID=UPI0013544031|nr:cytochrome o ubiquinol oxidase subunit IV [Bordetella sp. 02P26C-1]MVW80344.1 cytochrome o ubiquinol oxidase subunit IV [Bordetella sp. 02P26C-1]